WAAAQGTTSREPGTMPGVQGPRHELGKPVGRARDVPRRATDLSRRLLATAGAIARDRTGGSGGSGFAACLLELTPHRARPLVGLPIRVRPGAVRIRVLIVARIDADRPFPGPRPPRSSAKLGLISPPQFAM